MNEAAAASSMLEIRNLHAWYGESHILHGIDLDVKPGECVTLLGRNGAGRSSTLKSILGLVGRRSGSIKIQARRPSACRPTRSRAAASAIALKSAAFMRP